MQSRHCFAIASSSPAIPVEPADVRAAPGRVGGAADAGMEDPRGRLANRAQLATDERKAYPEAVEGAFGGDVDFARLAKLYGAAEGKGTGNAPCAPKVEPRHDPDAILIVSVIDVTYDRGVNGSLPRWSPRRPWRGDVPG